MRAVHRLFRLLRHGLLAATACLLTLSVLAATPRPEQLLPDDTLMVLTAPDFLQLQEICQASPKGRLWNDPLLKPLKDKFIERWREEMVKPLERDLNLSLGSWASLLQGQVIFAVTRGAWQGAEDQPLGFLFLFDARDRAGLLQTNLAALRAKWLADGRRCKTERIRNLEFTIFPATTNDMPSSVAKLLWRPPVFARLYGGADVKQAPVPESTTGDTVLHILRALLTDSRVLVVGQVGSFLVMGNSVMEVEKVVIRLTGGARPTLGDVPAYQTSMPGPFCAAPFYGWINVKAIVDALVRKSAAPDSPQHSDPLAGPRLDKVMAATGLDGCKSLAFNLHEFSEGSVFQISLSVPDATRRGVFQILACRPGDAAPPPFVPADATEFFRWRVDGTRTWLALEKMFEELSSQALSAINLILNTADARAKQDDPGFNLKQTLLANLGDDIIRYERGPRGSTAADLRYSPSIVLLGSPNPELLAVALKRLFVIFPQGDKMTEREFLGRKIFSVATPPLPLFPTVSPKSTPARTLHWAASGSYVALATDAALLEEYLRGPQPQAKALRDTVGLLEAAQNVGGMGTGLFGYENEATGMRAAFETSRNSPTASTNGVGPSLFPGLPGLTGPEEELASWMDFSLLPPFDRVSQYFSYSLFALSANSDGLTLKTFTHRPPALRNAAIARRAR